MKTKDVAQQIVEMPLVRGFQRYDFGFAEETLIQKFLGRSYYPKELEQEIADAEKESSQLYYRRYVIFEFTFDAPYFPRDPKLGEQFPQLRKQEIRNGEEVESLKHYLLRFTTPSGVSHLGIVGSFVHELHDTLGDYLKFGDIKLHQTHHHEPLCAAATKDFYLQVQGGGFFEINSMKKKIRFFGRSKMFETILPDAKEFAAEEFDSKKAFHLFAGRIMDSYLVKKDLGYKTYSRRR